LYLFAATGPIPGFPTNFGSGFVTLSNDPGAFRDGILATMQSQFAAADRAFDTISFNVVPKPVSPLPDLMIESAAIGSGVRPLTIVVLRNVGTRDASAFRLTVNSDAGTTYMDINDGLAAGESRTLRVAAPISGEVTVVVDADNQVTESDETNNTATAAR